MLPALHETSGVPGSQHRASRIRYIYAPSGSALMIDGIRQRIRVDQTAASVEVLREWSEKSSDDLTELLQEETIRKSELWAEFARDGRQVFARYLVHGYHNLPRTNYNAHVADENVGPYCGTLCPKYHATRCLTGFNRELRCVATVE